MSEPQGVNFCPECSSPTVDVSAIIGGEAKCRACGWKGSADSLLFVPLNMKDETMVLRLLTDDIRTLFYKHATPFAEFFIKWGFLSRTRIQEDLPRYMKGVAISFCSTVLRIRSELAVEQAITQQKKVSHGG